ncbi:ATP-dependent DNA helicase At3g02060, chloroplastic isoform X3 [Populus alba]|uniref:ATP-dependent DNA helicase At3g02060, chloroplastic isoform X3 n=1 Tax=Populus alba TaxID=43335 RepID=UPI003CC785A9
MFSVTRWNLIRLVPGIMLCIKRWELGGLLGLSLMCQRVLPRLLNVFIEYADGMAKLPVKQASRMLYRYNLPNDTKKPRTLSKLSDNGAWERRKTKGKVAIQKMVVDLMELYLHRLKQRRPPYPKTSAMVDFSAQFPYEPTPDQKQAFINVMRDLTERETPMDRLICGDVGFGKTEVALRAIFCVVSAGKKAMVLAPTIVLAKQHFDAFPSIPISRLRF